MLPIREIRQLLVRDLRRGMDQLADQLDPRHPFYNRFLGLHGDFHDLHRRHLEELLSPTDFRIGVNRVRMAVLHLLDDLETPDTSKSPDYRTFDWSGRSPVYLETFSAPNVDHPIFTAYAEGAWTAEFKKGTYQLSNRRDPYAVRYHHLNINGQDMSALAVSLEVKLEPLPAGAQPGAGLQFCFSPDSRRYYAFLLGGDGEYLLWRKDPSGYTPLCSVRSDRVRPEGFNKIGVIKTAEEIYLFINDHCVRRIAEAQLAGGDTGIIAMGLGHFTFDNLTFFAR